jgi:GAF domain-containing protein/HAMP domain-containing protein
MTKQPSLRRSAKLLTNLRDLPIAGKLAVLVLVPLILVSVLTLVLTLVGLNQFEQDSGSTRLQEEVQIVKQEFVHTMADQQANVTKLTDDPALLNAIERGERDVAQSLLAATLVRASHLNHIQAVDTNNQSLAIKGVFEIGGLPAEVIRLNSLGLLQIQSTELVNTDRGWLLTTVRPLKTQAGQVVGALSIGQLLDPARLFDFNFARTNPRLVLFGLDDKLGTLSALNASGDLGGQSFDANPTALTQARTGKIGLSQTSIQGEPYQVAYTLLVFQDEPIGVAGIAFSTADTAALRDQLLLGLLVTALISLVWSTTGAMELGQKLIVRPLIALAAGAKQIAGGQLNVVVPGEALQDEIGALAAAFNNMTAQLRGVINSLETRSVQLTTSAEVSRAITSVLDPDELVQRVTHLITERFNFYYAAIFLIDETGRFAVLREATGEAGRKLKERHHQLEVGGNSMVGYATAQRQARVALDVGEEAVRFVNPLLPDTRSEIALPLMVADRVFGAMDVQSTAAGAFDEGTIVILQSLVDQVAIALNNAREFQNAQLHERQSLALYEASQATADITEGLTLAVSRLLSTVMRHAHFDAGMAASLDATGQTYTIITAFDTQRATPLENVGQIVTINRSETPAALALQARQPIISNAAASDPRLAHLSAAILSSKGKLISVPALLGARMLGVITLSRGLDKPDISDGEAQLIQAIASQLATTIENHRLLEHAQTAAAEVNELIGRYTREGWIKYGQTRPGALLEHHYSQPGADAPDPDIVDQIEDLVRSQPGNPVSLDKPGLAGVPIMLRGEVLGTIGLQTDADHPFTEDELATVQAVANQVAQSIEAARLLEETERLANRERTINEINSRVRQTINIDTILKTAVNELGQSLKAARVTARINVADIGQQTS